eukprot:m.99623 g.99623  ORF g.99623 m.99623 type:complete len:60 (+) comp16768_c0_seq1:655-834(+)
MSLCCVYEVGVYMCVHAACVVMQICVCMCVRSAADATSNSYCRHRQHRCYGNGLLTIPC